MAVYRHLPERVKRRFEFVQDVPRHPSSVARMPLQVLTTVLLNAQSWLYPHWIHRCERPWHHDVGYMAWYAKASHPRILPLDEGSPPRPVNVEQIIEEEHARDVVRIVDNALARRGEMIREELLQEMTRIGSIGRPTLTYQIARQRRGQRHRRQHG